MQNTMESDSIFNETLNIKNDKKKPSGAWKIIIADDDKQVHSSTRIVLKDLIYEDKKINFLSAYSAAELIDV